MTGRRAQSPEMSHPLRKNLPIIGTLAKDAVDIDAKQVNLKEEFQKKSRACHREKEVSGESDAFANL